MKLLPSSSKRSKEQVVWAMILFLSGFGLSHPAKAQTNKMNTVRDSMSTHEMPQFRGGTDNMYSIISEHLNYPKAARKDGVSGRVVVGFIVDTTGTIADIHIREGVRPDIDQEALRLVGLLKNWKPGRIDGKPVRVRYELPLTFLLDNMERKKGKAGKHIQ